jgi:ethanolamine utilization protein EutQ (cupin superfamily)
MDRRVLDDSFTAMEETLGANKPSSRRIILQSRATRLAAAAAVIIVAITLLMVRQGPPEQHSRQTVATNMEKSPAKMLSMMSLNMAYRRGGIEAVDEQSNKAFEMLGSQPAIVSVKELLAESNGV